jgi:hypothetical protein
MLPFGVTIPATVPQGSEIPEGLMNNPVFTAIQAPCPPLLSAHEQRMKCCLLGVDIEIKKIYLFLDF